MKPPSIASLRRLMAVTLAASITYGETPNKATYQRMIRAKAIFYGNMLIRIRSDKIGIDEESDFDVP